MAAGAGKKIGDNVYGYINVNDAELKVIDTPIFQRLRYIKQLGATDFVYPGATHTRFSHCLGTMHLVGQFTGSMKSRGIDIGNDKEEREKLRLAALLHDVGHYPYSHTTENVVVKEFKGKNHEEFGAYLIKKFLAEKLGSYSPSEIIDIFMGKRSTSSLLISSALDADKADYLMRDSYNAGVPYGRVSLQTLIRTMSYVNNGIVFERDEVAVENFLIGRYHMYRAVYYHKAVVSFNLMVEKIFKLLVEEGYLTHPNDLLKGEDEIEISGYTDALLMTAMHEYMRSGKDGFLRSLIRLFLSREPLTCLYLSPQTSERGMIPKEIAKVQRLSGDDNAKRRLAARAGVDGEEIFAVTMRPLSLIDEKTKVYVRSKGELKSITESGGLVLNMVGSRTLYDSRVYSMPGRSKSVLEALKRYLKK